MVVPSCSLNVCPPPVRVRAHTRTAFRYRYAGGPRLIRLFFPPYFSVPRPRCVRQRRAQFPMTGGGRGVCSTLAVVAGGRGGRGHVSVIELSPIVRRKQIIIAVRNMSIAANEIKLAGSRTRTTPPYTLRSSRGFTGDG